jgi:hypothetical protein
MELAPRKNPTVLHLIERVKQTQLVVNQQSVQITQYLFSQQVKKVDRKQALRGEQPMFSKIGGLEAAQRIKVLLDNIQKNLVDILYFLRHTSSKDLYPEIGRIVHYLDQVDASMRDKQSHRYVNMDKQILQLEKSFRGQDDINIGYYLKCLVKGGCQMIRSGVSAASAAITGTKRRRVQQ